MILGDKSHIFRAEQGGSAAFGGVHPMVIRNHADGTLDFDDIRANIRADNEHYPITKLVCVENTQNLCGGRVLPLAYMDAVGDLAHEHGLKLHVDGARLWNAAVALGVSPARVARNADSVSLCLSKGLGAPVGSVVVGDKAFIGRARRARKAVGGGLRQAGILAAAGIVAVTEMVERLSDDHANAKQLAEGLAQIEGIQIDPADVETNLVFFELTHPDVTPAQLVNGLAAQGVKLSATSNRRLRAVLNHHVTAEDVDQTLTAFRTVLSQPVHANGQKVVAYG
jgi:threonine aldolase